MTLEVHDAFGDWKRQQRDDEACPVMWPLCPPWARLHEGHVRPYPDSPAKRLELGSRGGQRLCESDPVQRCRGPFGYPNTQEADSDGGFGRGRCGGVSRPRKCIQEGCQSGPPSGLWWRNGLVGGGASAGSFRRGRGGGPCPVSRHAWNQTGPISERRIGSSWRGVQSLVRREFPDLTIVPVPTRREGDGLAMSSRNVRLE